jgi:hypothetical protein
MKKRKTQPMMPVKKPMIPPRFALDRVFLRLVDAAFRGVAALLGFLGYRRSATRRLFPRRESVMPTACLAALFF